MKLSSKRHGRINVFYYENPVVFHTYTLSGRTIGDRLKWMYKHITDRTAIKKSELGLIASEDGVRMFHTTTSGRMYIRKICRSRYVWREEKVIDMTTMHEDYEYNQ